VQDIISGAIYNLQCKVVINATGIFTDEVLQMDDAAAKNIVSPSQGIHLVVDKKFFAGSRCHDDSQNQKMAGFYLQYPGTIK